VGLRGLLGDNCTFLYVDDVRTSQESHLPASVACYGDSFTLLFYFYVRTKFRPFYSSLSRPSRWKRVETKRISALSAYIWKLSPTTTGTAGPAEVLFHDVSLEICLKITTLKGT
jgi:hypothetical protein